MHKSIRLSKRGVRWVLIGRRSQRLRLDCVQKPFLTAFGFSFNFNSSNTEKASKVGQRNERNETKPSWAAGTRAQVSSRKSRNKAERIQFCASLSFTLTCCQLLV